MLKQRLSSRVARARVRARWLERRSLAARSNSQDGFSSRSRADPLRGPRQDHTYFSLMGFCRFLQSSLTTSSLKDIWVRVTGTRWQSGFCLGGGQLGAMSCQGDLVHVSKHI